MLELNAFPSQTVVVSPLEIQNLLHPQSSLNVSPFLWPIYSFFTSFSSLAKSKNLQFNRIQIYPVAFVLRKKWNWDGKEVFNLTIFSYFHYVSSWRWERRKPSSKFSWKVPLNSWGKILYFTRNFLIFLSQMISI